MDMREVFAEQWRKARKQRSRMMKEYGMFSEQFQRADGIVAGIVRCAQAFGIDPHEIEKEEEQK